MIKYAYTGYDEHKAEHKIFIEKLGELKTDFAKGKTTMSLEILNFLKDWLLNHIRVTG